MDHSFRPTCKLHHAYQSFESVHQMAPPLTEVAEIQLQLTTHLSTAHTLFYEVTETDRSQTKPESHTFSMFLMTA